MEEELKDIETRQPLPEVSENSEISENSEPSKASEPS